MSSLWISDASPLFFYSPAEAYFSGQNLASWVGKTGAGDGDGQMQPPSGSGSESGTNGIGSTQTGSYHATSGPASVVVPLIYATSFTPIFTAPDSFQVTLQRNSNDPEGWESGRSWNETDSKTFDAQTFTLAAKCKDGQEDRCKDQQVGFWGAWVGTQFTPPGSELDTVAIDDTSEVITYAGFAPVNKDNKLVNVTQSEDYEGTLSMTATEGATAQIVFNGASISVRGVTCPSCGTFTVTLDDSSTKATLNSQNNATVHDSLLFFATNLDTSTSHTLTLESQGGVVIDKLEAMGPKGGIGFGGTTNTSSSSNPSSTPMQSGGSGTPGNSGSPNAGIIVGAVLGSLAGLAFLYWFCRRVKPAAKKAEDKKLNPWDEANLLQNMKNEEVHVTTAANQRYVYRE
ncbi:hypothetical protein I317_04410 [Kwoniella heveanensis CBS 569]|nr:hypothetical protein I317_04410 [Kwoniella heveanensis CBS 569]